MDFLEGAVEFLHDLLYSDNVPIGYKQQAHKLIDLWKEETGQASPTPKEEVWSVMSNGPLGHFTLSKKDFDDIQDALNQNQKINAIKILRSSLVVGKDATGAIIRPGLKEAKDTIDAWGQWAKIKQYK